MRARFPPPWRGGAGRRARLPPPRGENGDAERAAPKAGRRQKRGGAASKDGVADSAPAPAAADLADATPAVAA